MATTSGSSRVPPVSPSEGAAVPPLVLQEVHEGVPAEGRLFNLVDLAADPDGPPAASAVLGSSFGATAELQQFRTHPALPQTVVTRRLMACLADLLRSSGCRRLLTGVAEHDLDRQRVLESAGFRRTSETSSPGVVCLELAL